MAFIACSKTGPEPCGEGFSLYGSLPGTRTCLGNKSFGSYPLIWSAGDMVRANGMDSYSLTSDAATASFRFDSDPGAPYNILYGALAGRDDAVEIPSVQKYVPEGIGGNCLPMWACAEGKSFTMDHLCAVIAVRVSGPGKVSGIRLHSSGGEALSGSFRLVKENGRFTGGMVGESLSSTVHLTMPDSGIAMEESPLFMISVLPTALEKGITVDIYDTDGGAMRTAAMVGEVLEAGKVYELAPLQYRPNLEPVTMIYDYAGLKLFASRAEAGEKYLRARLAADVTADASWRPIESFKGELDGAGHRISGLKRALVNELCGAVSNLTVSADINISRATDISAAGTVSWAGIIANRVYTNGSITNCVAEGRISYRQFGKELTAGGLAGYITRGAVTSSVNKAEIRIVGDGSASVNVGGVAGRVYSGAEGIILQNCRNDGPVNLRGALAETSVGAVAGRFDAPESSVLETLVNNGKVEIAADADLKGVLNLGGVLGLSKNNFSLCANYGTLHCSASSNAVQNIGGVAGAVTVTEIDGCIGAGRILCDGSRAAAVRCGGVVGFASGSAASSSTELFRCEFKGLIDIDIASHSTIYAKPFTALYSTASHSETDCINSGNISVK